MLHFLAFAVFAAAEWAARSTRVTSVGSLRARPTCATTASTGASLSAVACVCVNHAQRCCANRLSLHASIRAGYRLLNNVASWYRDYLIGDSLHSAILTQFRKSSSTATVCQTLRPSSSAVGLLAPAALRGAVPDSQMHPTWSWRSVLTRVHYAICSHPLHISLLHRHVLAGRGNDVALIWDADEPGQGKTYTYQQVGREVHRVILLV